MKKAAFLFFLVGSEKRRLCGALFCFFGYEVLYDFAKVCRKGKNEVFQNGGVCVHRLGFLGKGQAHKPIEHFYDFEQLPPVGGGVHGNKYVGQAVYGFHVALLISPDGSIIPLSKSTFFMSSSYNLWCQNGARSYKIILYGDMAR